MTQWVSEETPTRLARPVFLARQKPVGRERLALLMLNIARSERPQLTPFTELSWHMTDPLQ
jgi:hypothetical protein